MKLAAPYQELTAAFQDMNVSKPRHGTIGPHNAIIPSMPPRQYQSLGIPVHSPFAMYPLVYQAPFSPGISYVMEHMTPSSAVPPATPSNFPLLGPVFPQIQSVVHLPNDFSQPRTPYSYPRADSRRQNAARVTRSPYYNLASHHNHVDVNRIREGIDVRTTVRDMPGITQARC
jgi:hypothetical protein